MYVINLYGMFLFLYLLILIIMYISYEVGYEDAKRKYKFKNRRKKVGDYKDGRRFRTRNFSKRT